MQPNQIFLDLETGQFIRTTTKFHNIKCEQAKQRKGEYKMNTEIKTNFYTIFSQRLAGYLMMNGLPLIKLVPDNSRGSKNSFLFVNSAKLHDLMDKWTAERNKIYNWFKSKGAKLLWRYFQIELCINCLNGTLI